MAHKTYKPAAEHDVQASIERDVYLGLLRSVHELDRWLNFCQRWGPQIAPERRIELVRIAYRRGVNMNDRLAHLKTLIQEETNAT